MLFDHNVSIEGIENLFDKFGKKIHSFEDLCDYQAYLSLYLPFSKQDNMIISLMFFQCVSIKKMDIARLKSPQPNWRII